MAAANEDCDSINTMFQIESPCLVSWDSMSGNDRARTCRNCRKKVFNISNLTNREARLLAIGSALIFGTFATGCRDKAVDTTIVPQTAGESEQTGDRSTYTLMGTVTPRIIIPEEVAETAPSTAERPCSYCYMLVATKSGKDARSPLTLLTPPIHSPVHHDLRHAGGLGEVIHGDQQVTLLGDAW